MKRLAAIAFACAALAGCATPTAYGPATGPNASGFWEQKIEADRFRISYRGGNGAPPAQVADYALLRAAQVTRGEGYDWFRVIARYREGVAGRGPQLSLGLGSTSYGRRSAVGVGARNSFDLSGGPQMAETLEIKLAKGAKPADPDSFDAEDVIRTITPRLPPPPIPR